MVFWYRGQSVAVNDPKVKESLVKIKRNYQLLQQSIKRRRALSLLKEAYADTLNLDLKQ